MLSVTAATTFLPIDALSLTSGEFVTAAAERGHRDRAAALNVYRSIFRDGALPMPWATASVGDIVRTQQEGPTVKFAQRIDDQLESESVILPQKSRIGRDRNTLCVSSQVGCAMGCTFCETAQMGLMRNLTPSQILSQWHAARFQLHAEISNIVFMGMGEPMENLDAVIQAIRVLTDQRGPAIAPSRIAVSTVGRAEGILKLAAFAQQPGFRRLCLAVSINAPNDEIRSQLMPINRSTNMAALHEAMMQWPNGPTRRILIEYVFIPGVNDRLEHADELCEYLKPLYCTVNVIPYNPRRNSPWPAPDEADVIRFVERISATGQFVTRRRTMGRSLMAACGQLGNEAIRKRKFVDVRTST
ncbi:MAG TPA: 23S rRNA (adenine(2503)-C(2))-methyltransferase RlmN [Phycisphaerales bacterium]|nr:23S rRNA (adenine(2503)-C(2))-methyltransferase RlmN [Phycisphaerales bacterium]